MIENERQLPANYEELYVHYYRMIVSIMLKAGVPRSEVEDGAGWMMVKLMEKDILGMFDPEKVFDVGERPRVAGERLRKANFSGLLRRFVYLHSLQYRDRCVSAARQSPVDPLSGGVWDELWVDGGVEAVEGRVCAEGVLDALRDVVAVRAPHLLRTLGVMRAFPELSRAEWGELLGVSGSSVGAHVRALRELLLSEVEGVRPA